MNNVERGQKNEIEDDRSHLYHNPIERFWQLSETTRKWLENLRPEDIKEMNDAIKLKRKIEAGGWLFKWISITIVSFFVGAAALGESLQKVWAMLIHAVR
jgi:hypothetical protein